MPPEKDPLPAGLDHRKGPMNKSTGRHQANPKPDDDAGTPFDRDGNSLTRTIASPIP
jgi:hypothetical protein